MLMHAVSSELLCKYINTSVYFPTLFIQVKNVYPDSCITCSTKESASSTSSGNEDNSNSQFSDFCLNSPYFDEAQEIDKSWLEGYTGLNACNISFNFVENNTDPTPSIFPHYPESLSLTKMETVIVKLDFVFPKYTRTVVTLISPCGTEFILMEQVDDIPEHDNADEHESISDAFFRSNHFSGEPLEGTWP
ncbi:hypothetical protein MAR_020159 [Mya arenaria]|uniref:P/Homo B domain-containing protein n=1 Tax=Mya arenaria TaxID=6604 RepID=A0ABY7E453_MYAAR|nr:hypothetical protein MAR_020159 [Mya arenaria]